MARKLTRTPEGKVVAFSTKRGRPDMCSDSCSGIYKTLHETYCEYFDCIVGKRHRDCIRNEIKGGG